MSISIEETEKVLAEWDSLSLPDENSPVSKVQFSVEVENTIRKELLHRVFVPPDM